MITPEQTQRSLDWLNTSITIRQPKSKQKFCDSIGISVPTLNKIDEERRNGKKPRFDTPNIDDLPQEEKIKIFDRLLFQLIQDPKTPSKDRELFAKRYGLLVDKSINIDVKIGADELFRARNEARRELERDGFTVAGSGKVRPQPALLSENIRQS